jgi:predicted DNA-binding transcriptional regulator YafY
MPLRRADRLFDILRVVRAASHPVTAASLADELEVTVRTVYRDIATLQARRIPIEGALGIGYGLRRGFELPPLMFTEDEAAAGWSSALRTGSAATRMPTRTTISQRRSGPVSHNPTSIGRSTPHASGSAIAASS